MTSNSANNKRIAKNTLLLYVRMLFIMGVQLFTSRVVLNTLGVVDYGIYNVVGGVVSMFAFLNGAMVTSTQRYLTFELSKGDLQRLKVVFTTSVQIHLIISLVIVALGETVGLWFFYEKMVIPPERFTAAMWVYQLSILTMVVQVMSVPYNSTIVAHEQMGIFAVISVVEITLKLAVVYLLVIGNFDKLIFYAILIALVQLFVRFLYTRYCSKNYEESKLIKSYDKNLMKEMSKFMGWNIWGNLAATLFGTGLNLLLNVFFGPVVNAARAVAVQVETAIANFSTNFLMAVNPQITKLYAQENLAEMHKLLFRASKFTFFLLFTLSLPVMIETEPILTVWLKIVPDYSVIFLRLLLCIVMIDAVVRPLMHPALHRPDCLRGVEVGRFSGICLYRASCDMLHRICHEIDYHTADDPTFPAPLFHSGDSALCGRNRHPRVVGSASERPAVSDYSQCHSDLCGKCPAGSCLCLRNRVDSR